MNAVGTFSSQHAGITGKQTLKAVCCCYTPERHIHIHTYIFKDQPMLKQEYVSLHSANAKWLWKAAWRGQGSLGERLQTGLTTCSRERENSFFLLYSGFNVLIFNIIVRKTEMQGQPFVNIFRPLSHLNSLPRGQMVWKPCSSTNFQHVKRKQYKHILSFPLLALFSFHFIFLFQFQLWTDHRSIASS